MRTSTAPFGNLGQHDDKNKTKQNRAGQRTAVNWLCSGASLSSIHHKSFMKSEILTLVANGLYKESILLYSNLHSASTRLPHFIFPSLLKACAKLQSLPHLQIVHAHVTKLGFQSSVYSATALVDAYMKVCEVSSALQMFDESPGRNLAVMNAAVSGFSQCGMWWKAFKVFKEIMGVGEFRPNGICVASIVGGCERVEVGRSFHCLAVKLGVVGDVYVGSSLVTMYLNCADHVAGTDVFKSMRNKSVVSYNTFMTGLLRNREETVVLEVLKDMLEKSDEVPNVVTLVSVLSACAMVQHVKLGEQVHALLLKMRLSFDTVAGTALVDMYSKCGEWQSAYKFFNEMGDRRNLFTWNSMISGLIFNDQGDKGVLLFQEMKSLGLKPDAATWSSLISGFSQTNKHSDTFQFFRFMLSTKVEPGLRCLTSVLKACSDTFATRQGKEMHAYLIRTSKIEADELVVTAMIDMYMSCGCSSMAQKVFDHLGSKPVDPAAWNAMISGYGKNGEDELALDIFNQMVEVKRLPNLSTFTAVVSACSHTGRVDEGRRVFAKIRDVYGLTPSVETYSAMVDLLGRSGCLEEARKLVDEMSQPPPASVFASLLGACKNYLNSEMAEEVASKLREVDPENSSPFVILSNIYAAQGRWTDAERIRHTMDDTRVKKLPAYSMIEVA